MTYAKNIMVAAFFVALSGCGGSSSNGGNSPSTPTPSGPRSESIADLAAFAASGTQTVNLRGVNVRANSYTNENGVRNVVSLSGSEQVGLLTVDRGSNPIQTHTIIGADQNKSVNHKGYYVAETSGAMRMRNGDSIASVQGDTAIAMDSSSGQWSLGSTVWQSDGQTGAYIGMDDGSVRGNTMIFDPKNSKMSEITSNRVISSNEKAGARAVFSDNGEQVFGKVTGSNQNTGFMVDLGFAGKQFE